MHSVMHTMRMPQSMRTPTRLDYGDDGASTLLLLILTLFLPSLTLLGGPAYQLTCWSTGSAYG